MSDEPRRRGETQWACRNGVSPGLHFLSYQMRSQCARELHGADGREQMQQISVITEPENGIDKDSERRCNQGGHGTGIGCLSDGAKGALC